MACYSWWHLIFETDRRNVKNRTKCFSEEVLHVCEKERSHSVSLQKFINEVLLRAAIDRFLRARGRSTNHFPLSLTLLLRRQIKHYSICKRPQKNGQRHGCQRTRTKKLTSNEQTRKLFDSVELGRAESNNPAQLPRTT